MKWRRILLSMVLIGGCLWCMGAVRQVYCDETSALPARTEVVRPAFADRGVVGHNNTSSETRQFISMPAERNGTHDEF